MAVPQGHTLGSDSCMFQVIIRILIKGESLGDKVGSIIAGGVDTVTAGTLLEGAVEGSSPCRRRAKLVGWANWHDYEEL